MASRKNRNQSTATVAELEERVTIENELLEPGEWEEEWNQDCKDNGANIWDFLEFIPEAHLNEVHGYLYRLEPKVYNDPSGGSNIKKYYSPQPTLESVKEEHGGGKYRYILKRGKRTLGTWHFSIDGPPKYLEGQRDAGGKLLSEAPATQHSPARNDTAETIRAIKEVIQPDRAADATVDMLKSAFTTGMQTIAAAQAKPAAENPILNKILEKQLTANPIEQFSEMLAAMKALIPQPVAPNPAPQTLGVAELFSNLKPFGIENIEDLFSRKSGAGEKSIWEMLAPAITNLTTNIPALIQGLRAMSEDSFRRNLIMLQVQHSLAAKGETATPSSPDEIINKAVQNPAIPAPEVIPPGVTQQAATPEMQAQQAILDIMQFFASGTHGGICAGYLVVKLPLAVKQLELALGDRAKLDAVVSQIPPLAEIASKHPEDWKVFLDQFQDYFADNAEQPDQGEAGDDGGDKQESPPVN